MVSLLFFILSPLAPANHSCSFLSRLAEKHPYRFVPSFPRSLSFSLSHLPLRYSQTTSAAPPPASRTSPSATCDALRRPTAPSICSSGFPLPTPPPLSLFFLPPPTVCAPSSTSSDIIITPGKPGGAATFLVRALLPLGLTRLSLTSLPSLTFHSFACSAKASPKTPESLARMLCVQTLLLLSPCVLFSSPFPPRFARLTRSLLVRVPVPDRRHARPKGVLSSR